MGKTLPMIGLVAALTLSGLNVNAQTKKEKDIDDKAKKELVDNFNKEEKNIKTLDSLDHKNIISKDINEIFKEYGEKEGLLVINNHLMIEMNTIRKNYGSPELLGLDENLIDFAINQAVFLDKEGHIYHTQGEDVLRKRLERAGFEFNTSGENLALGQPTIDSLVKHWMRSPGHKANILKKTYKKMGLGVKNKTRVLNRIG